MQIKAQWERNAQHIQSNITKKQAKKEEEKKRKRIYKKRKKNTRLHTRKIKRGKEKMRQQKTG